MPAGSVSSFLLPPGTETLTGRVHRLSLMPLAAAETFGAKQRWLAQGGEPHNFRIALGRTEVFDVVAAGGYPAALRRATPTQRTRWFASYLATVTDRDLPHLIDVRHSGALSRLYRLIAQRTSSTAVNTELARSLDVSQPTVATYRRLLAPLPHDRAAWLDGRRLRQDRSPGESSRHRYGGSPLAFCRSRRRGSVRRRWAVRSSNPRARRAHAPSDRDRRGADVRPLPRSGITIARERRGLSRVGLAKWRVAGS